MPPLSELKNWTYEGLITRKFYFSDFEKLPFLPRPLLPQHLGAFTDPKLGPVHRGVGLGWVGLGIGFRCNTFTEKLGKLKLNLYSILHCNMHIATTICILR